MLASSEKLSISSVKRVQNLEILIGDKGGKAGCPSAEMKNDETIINHPCFLVFQYASANT